MSDLLPILLSPRSLLSFAIIVAGIVLFAIYLRDPQRADRPWRLAAAMGLYSLSAAMMGAGSAAAMIGAFFAATILVWIGVNGGRSFLKRPEQLG